MFIKSLLGLLLASLAVARNSRHSTRPSNSTQPTNSTCTQPRVRKEWRVLSSQEKTDYLQAVRCLYDQPSRSNGQFPANNRHDDFVALHIIATGPPAPDDPASFYLAGPGIHFVGAFLPWHRYVLYLYETALREECSYRGAQPYWDWSLDSIEHNRTFSSSPVFDSVLGFGGNGVNGSSPTPQELDTPSTPPFGSCIGDGPFAGILNPLGWGYDNLNVSRPHCLMRNLQDDLADIALPWQANVVPLLRMDDFTNFTLWMDRDAGDTGSLIGIHGTGHFCAGGEMRNVWSSPNDPLFFMHHTQLDRIWSLWQSLHPSIALEVGGPIYPNGTGTTTLDDPLHMIDAVGPSVRIREVMDAMDGGGYGRLCYRYQENGEPVV